MRDCLHTETRLLADERPFTGPVSYRRGAKYNPAAHGNLECTEECVACGAQRRTLINGWHREIGAWSVSRAVREAREREANREARLAAEQREDDAAVALRVRVVCLDNLREQALVEVGAPGARAVWCWIFDLEAASQYDDEAGLAYRALVRQARRTREVRS